MYSGWSHRTHYFYTAHGGSDFAGVCEVQFFNIPEPSALALVGLSILGLCARRRR